MKFEIFRDSDQEQGRVGRDVLKPFEDAVFNEEEERWEIEVKDLDELLSVLNKIEHPAIVVPGCDVHDNPPYISIIDASDPDERLHAVN